jgi:probable HAF family extracellular repeat protein
VDNTTDTRHGYILHAGTYRTLDFPGANYTEAWKINDSGQVVGRYVGADGNYHVYLFTNGSFVSFDYPGALQTAPEDYSHVGGLNNLGDITTDYANGAPFKQLLSAKDAGHIHGFILSGGVFASFDFPAAAATLPFGINDNRQVVGVYADVNEAFHGFLRTP